MMAGDPLIDQARGIIREVRALASDIRDLLPDRAEQLDAVGDRLEATVAMDAEASTMLARTEESTDGK